MLLKIVLGNLGTCRLGVEKTCFSTVFLHLNGIIFTGFATFPNIASSFMMASLETNGGTLEIVIFVAGADNRETGTKASITHNPSTVNWFNNASDLKNNTTADNTALFIRKAEITLSNPTVCPTTTSNSSTVTPASGTHVHPLRRDKEAIAPCTGTAAILAPRTCVLRCEVFFTNK